MPDLMQRLSDHPFLEDFDPGALSFLLECASWREAAAGEVLFRQGESADCFYLIDEGRVAIETSARGGGDPFAVQVLSDGDALGWSWLFPPYFWHFSARAVAATRLISIAAPALRAKMAADPHFGRLLTFQVANLLAQRLRATRLRLAAAIQPPTSTPAPDAAGPAD